MKMIGKLIALAVLLSATASLADTTTFGSANDGLGGFTHTKIDGTNTFLTTNAGSVGYRNQNAGSVDAAFLKQYTIDRTPGNSYTVSGTMKLNNGYADDNNRIDILLFTDPTTALSRNNLGQIGIVWNTDDSSSNDGSVDTNTVSGIFEGNDAPDNLSIYNGFNNTDADITVLGLLRDQTVPYSQDLFAGTEITLSATFAFVGTNITIDASLTDIGGVTTIGTATVSAADFTGDYFGFASTYRARNYTGTGDSAAGRSLPLEMEYQSFSVTQVPEPATVGLFGLGAIGVWIVRRNKMKATEQEEI